MRLTGSELTRYATLEGSLSCVDSSTIEALRQRLRDVEAENQSLKKENQLLRKHLRGQQAERG